MAGKDLLYQRAPRARHPNNEYGNRGWMPGTLRSLDELGCIYGAHLVKLFERRGFVIVILLSLESIACQPVAKRFPRLPDVVTSLAQSEMQLDLLTDGTRRAAFSHLFQFCQARVSCNEALKAIALSRK